MAWLLFLLECECWICLEGTGQKQKTPAELPKVHTNTQTHLHTMYFYAFRTVPWCTLARCTHFPLFTVYYRRQTHGERKKSLPLKKKKKKSRDRKKTGVKRGTRLKLTKKRRVDVPEFHLPVYQSPEDVS